MPRFSLRTLIIVMLPGGPALALVIVLMFSESGTNCGGNSAALSTVRTYCIIAHQLADESSSGRFSVVSATPDQLVKLAQVKSGGWTPTARYLVSVRPLSATELASPRYILCVCDRAYSNVPPQRIGTARPTHAAVYSDGSTDLISVAEFESLQQSDFIPLDELIGR